MVDGSGELAAEGRESPAAQNTELFETLWHGESSVCWTGREELETDGAMRAASRMESRAFLSMRKFCPSTLFG